VANDIANQLVEFGLRTKYGDISKDVIDYGKQLTLKTISGMLAGSRKPSARKVAGMIKEQKLPEQVGIVGNGFKTSLWEGVFLNAYVAHASELEDDRFNGAMGITWDIGVIPLVISLADKLSISGKSFLEALITGLEVTVRTGMFSAKPLGLGELPAAVGPVVSAARLLGLSTKETAGAMGLALSAPPLALVNFGTDGHFFESALQTRQAIVAAEMAQRGLAGNPDLGTFLTKFLGKDRVTPELIVEDLGKRWDLCEIWIKKYPVCFSQHRQIDSLLELKKQHNLLPGDVRAIEVHIGSFAKYLDRPEPKTEGDLEFSFQHTLSAGLLDGDVNLKNICEEAVHDPRFRETRSKVTVVYHPELGDAFDVAPSHIVIKMKDGREFSQERTFPLGDHIHAPLTNEQVQGLYAKFSEGVLAEKEITKVADMIWNLEELKNVKELTGILVDGPA
jgi:2-methylcitrate dehydratase PrpD